MKTIVDVKFRIKPKRVNDPVSGKEIVSAKHLLITMRVRYGSMRLEFSTGYNIDAEFWDAKAGHSIGMGETDHEINNGLKKMVSYVRDTVTLFMEKEMFPTQKQFRETFQMIKDGKIHVKHGKTASCIDDDAYDGHIFHHDSKPINRFLTFWDVYHEYENYNRKRKNWMTSTKKKYDTIRHNLKGFREWKRNIGLPYFDVSFDYFDDYGLQSFVDYLSNYKRYKNSTIKKDIVMLKVVLRWAYNMRYHNNRAFETFKPNLKSVKNRVIFLNMKEIKQLEDCHIPESKSHLIHTRDVFLFMCFTGLRYSDVANLRRYDVLENHIEVTTIKTIDSLLIDLNSHSRVILKKYESSRFKGDAALPIISNQKMNKNLHELCKLAGFDKPIRKTYFRGNERIDEVKPKYDFICTHTGRRSFICNALSKGISPHIVMKWTGHNDYKAMKPYIDVADETKAEAMKKFDGF